MADEIKIEDLEELKSASESDLIIIEDSEDTKKSTINNLKRSVFLGDYLDPSENKYYSSLKVEQLVNSVKISTGSSVSIGQFNELSTRVDSIVAQAGSDNTEVVDARGGYSTLSNRLSADKTDNDAKYLSYPYVSKNVSSINMAGYTDTKLDVVIPSSSEAITLTITSPNVLLHNTCSTGMSWEGKALKITQTTGTLLYTVICTSGLIKGGVPYYLYTDAIFGSTFRDTSSIKIVLTYADGGTLEIPYEYQKIFEFVPEKGVTKFSFKFNASMLVNNATVTFNNIMISTTELLNKYVEPYYSTKTYPANQASADSFIANDRTYTVSAGLFNASYYDNSIKSDTIYDLIYKINETMNGGIDHCGLMTNAGDYIFLNENIINQTTSACSIKINKSYSRNNQESIKFTQLEYDSTTTPTITKVLSEPKDLSKSKYISIQIYIDKPYYNNFTSSEGIKIMLSSDSIVSSSSTNYYYYNIAKNRFVQGWNTIKVRLTDFTGVGTPSLLAVNQIQLSIFSSKATEGMSLYLNSIIIDQVMTPTILFAFEKIYPEGFSYQYPLLYTAGIPCTVFLNNSDTFTTAVRNQIASLEYDQQWEIAQYSCAPNSEYLTLDDNARDQYLALRNTKLWLQENYTMNAISYSGPNGEIRPITTSILKNLGYKIGKMESSSYIASFSKDDFIVPTVLMNAYTTSIDSLKQKIDYAIETGQGLCLYTHNVTTYGSNIDCTKTIFEAIVSYIIEKQKTTDLKCMTFRDFYNTCIN